VDWIKRCKNLEDGTIPFMKTRLLVQGVALQATPLHNAPVTSRMLTENAS
jgi:hypothetical protein